MTVRPGTLVPRPYELPQLTPILRAALLGGGLTAAGLLGALGAQVGPETLALLCVGTVALLLAMASSYAALALLIMLLLVPLRSFSVPPLQINQLDAVYLATLFGLLLRYLGSGQRFEATALGLAVGAFVGSAALSSIVGVFGGAAPQEALSQFRGIAGYALVPLLFVSPADGESGRRGRTLIYLLCGVGALTAAQGVLSWAQLNGLFELPGAIRELVLPANDEAVGVVPALAGDFGYVRAWAGNLEGNTLGAFLLLLTPVAAYLAIRGDDSLRQIAFAVATALLLFALVVSYSRGAYLGLATASLPAFVLLWRWRPLVAIGLAAATVVALVLLINQIPGANDRLATVSALSDDPTIEHRQLVYEQAFDAVLRSPVWGAGLGTNVEDIGSGADSLYVFLLLRGGLLMAVAALVFTATAGRALFGAWRHGRVGGFELAISCGLLGFAVHSMFDYALWNPKVALVMWMLAGALMSAVLGERDDEGTADAKEEPRAPRSARW